MSDKAGSEIKITWDELANYQTRSTDMLKSVSYLPKQDLAGLRAARGSGDKPAGLSLSSALTQPTQQTMKILDTAAAVNKNALLMEENINFALNTVCVGLEIGLHLGSLHAKYSGLERLKEKQASKAAFSTAEQLEWTQLMEAQAAITLFAASYYIVWKLSNAKAEELSAINTSFAGLPEPLQLRGQVQALSGAIFHWGSYLRESQTGIEFLKSTLLFFRAVFDDIKAQSKSFEQSASVFIDTSYRLEGTEFAVTGFQGEIFGGKASAEFKPVRLDEVVGNHEAKRAVLRLSQFVIAYDMERKLNPFIEFGALPWIYLLKGEPGTGKTMLIRAMATMVQDYCGRLGLPFRLHELSNTVISTYQGGSAENLEKWYSVLRNPAEIIVAPVDDAENVFESRGGHNVSSGSKEATATLLRNTEGASAITRGNVLMPWGSNFPENIDPAAMSRIMGRMDVPGAKTPEDFMDQMGMWGRQANGWSDKQIVDLHWPEAYKYLSSQGITPPEEMSSRAEDAFAIRDTRLAGIYDELRAKNLTTHDYGLYGGLFAQIKQVLPRFTSREVRNITTNVMMRLFGFDFDSSWLESRDAFVAKDYDTKKAMILDCAMQNMKGVNVSEVLFQETVSYVNTMADIIDGGRSRRIREMADTIREQREAQAQASASA